MEVQIAADYDDMSRSAARVLRSWIDEVAAPYIVLPTGSTPVGLYASLVAESPPNCLERATVIQLDEYHGLARDDARTLSAKLARMLLEPLAIPSSRILCFDPAAEDCRAETDRIEAQVDASGIDIAILGLGLNGHVGFNEPGSTFESKSRLVHLTAETIRSNAAHWGGEHMVPRSGFTLGLGTLAQARRTLLMVSGEKKAAILAAVLEGPVSSSVPATYLRTVPGVTVIADRDALALWSGGCDR